MSKKKVKVVIIDNNPLSIASYLEEYGDSVLCVEGEK